LYKQIKQRSQQRLTMFNVGMMSLLTKTMDMEQTLSQHGSSVLFTIK